MANPSLILWCDPTMNKLYSGWNQNIQPPIPVLKQGDTVGVEIHWVNKGSYTSIMKEVAFPPSATVSLAIGVLDAAPTSGSFVLTYGANSTPELAYDITATELETALNALASITAEGGVTVEKANLIFRITWNDKIATTTALSCDTSCLYPTSEAAIAQAKAGSANSRRIMLLSLKQSALAAQNTFTTVGTPVISVENILPKTWRVSIDPLPKDGVFTITYVNGSTSKTTEPIPVGTSAATFASYLNAVENLSFTVSQSGDYSWDISCPSVVTDISATSGLIGFSSVYGTLDLNTVEIEQFLSGKTYDSAYLEVQVDVAGEVQTLIQTSVILMNDLIDQSSFNVVSRGSVMPLESVVRYDTSQALTGAQKTQARDNIDALGLTDLATVESDITALDGRVTTIEAYSVPNIPTANEKAALSGSASPSASNVVITNSALTSGLSTKAALVHTHVASDISDSTSYGRAVLTAASVSAQRTALGLGSIATESASTYATINNPTFTGTVTIPTGAYIADYLPLSGGSMTGTLYAADIQLFSSSTLSLGSGGIVFQDATTQDTRVVRETQTNTFTSAFTSTEYPNEIKVIDSTGTAYWVPARLV